MTCPRCGLESGGPLQFCSGCISDASRDREKRRIDLLNPRSEDPDLFYKLYYNRLYLLRLVPIFFLVFFCSSFVLMPGEVATLRYAFRFALSATGGVIVMITWVGFCSDFLVDVEAGSGSIGTWIRVCNYFPFFAYLAVFRRWKDPENLLMFLVHLVGFCLIWAGFQIRA